jgi:hypothetical protein
VLPLVAVNKEHDPTVEEELLEADVVDEDELNDVI